MTKQHKAPSLKIGEWQVSDYGPINLYCIAADIPRDTFLDYLKIGQDWAVKLLIAEIQHQDLRAIRNQIN